MGRSMGPTPYEDKERGAEAVRRLLPELCKLNRYQGRAYAIKITTLIRLRVRSSCL
jgi:hypothetical protein